MKGLFFTMFILVSFLATAQSKEEKAVIERTYLLNNTVFGTKDSLVLEEIFASTATYGHSGGKLQTKKEAIDGASSNKSTYSDTSISNLNVIFQGNAAIARYLFNANEHTVDGKIVPLHFSMMLVWVKEKGKWKLFGRQAIKVA